MNFWETLVECLKTLLIKCVSFKNIGFVVGTVLGVIMALKIEGTTFMQWGVFQLILIALFFTANEFQKWLIGTLLNRPGCETGPDEPPEP